MRVVEKPYLYRKRGAPTILSGRRLFPQGDPCLQGVAAEEFLRPRRKLVFFQEPYFYGKRGVPTRLSGCRLRSPGRPLLTMMGCRLRPPVADWCRLVPKTQLLHTRDGADRPTPFRSYIILYVNGDGGDRVRTPHCTGAPVPNGPFLFLSNGKYGLSARFTHGFCTIPKSPDRRHTSFGRKGARRVASQSCQVVFRTCL